MTEDRRQPIAIVGMAGIYPGAASLDELAARLRRGAGFSGDGDIGRSDLDLAAHGIPPAQAASMARVQLLVLQVVSDCLRDGGYGRDAARPFDRDGTDVIVGTCFGSDRAYDNALRVESARHIARFLESLRDAGGERLELVAAELQERCRATFGGTAHDRLGEMASTIPARISILEKLRGRCLAVEAADATSFVALQAGVDLLRARAAQMVIVTAAQVLDGPLVRRALAEKRFVSDAAAPFRRRSTGYVLGEGVGALLLKRLDDAERDGDRIYCTVRGVGLTHSSQPGSFRYATSVADRRAAIAEALSEAACEPATIQYVECFGSGIPAETELELEALADALTDAGAPPRPISLGCVKANVGHCFASSGLAAITKVALGLRDRTLFSQPPDSGEALDLSRTPFSIVDEQRPWPANIDGCPRRAGVAGAGFAGTTAHVVLEEHAQRRAAAVPASAPTSVPIAVVGIGGRFARAGSAAELWRNVCAKRDLIEPLPDSVVDRQVYYAPDRVDPFTTYSLLASRVEEPDLAHDDVRIPPRRLEYMDRAQKLALAAARELVSSFGHPRRPLPDRNAAVILGSSLTLGAERAASARLQRERIEQVFTGSPAWSTLDAPAREAMLAELQASLDAASPPLSGWSADGFLASGVAAVISNEFRLNAVPVAVEAACASSLAALDLAMRGLASGRYDFAVCGGVDLPANVRDLVVCSSLRLLSAERIAPFTAHADGISVGEGIALFALERLDDAIASGDPIFAVLRSLGASSDARSLVAPDADGQSLAIRRAFAGVDFAPDQVQYVEAHGTGTRAGDRAELRALASVYRDESRPAPLAVGSIKSMIGHSFAAAGAAGLLRTVLALRERTLPPTILAEPPDPELGLDAIPAYVPTEAEPWQVPPGARRRAAVSSMGTGGINYHLLLEEPPDRG